MCTMITCSTTSQGKFGNGNKSVRQFLADRNTQRKKDSFSVIHRPHRQVKVFYCENFFANYWKRLRGLLLINGVYHVKAVPPYNSTGEGYTNTGLTPSGTSGGYCSRMEMTSDIGRIPTVASGSETHTNVMGYVQQCDCCSCPVRWHPWRRVEVRSVVLACAQPCDGRGRDLRGEPFL